jgi:aminomethyltransferase
VEIYFKDKDGNAERIWNEIFRVGAPQGLKPIGLAARDTLRLEKGFALYGNDIDDTTSPLEAGLGWITKFSKDFTARGILEKQKAEGVGRKLVGIEMIDKGIPRHGYRIQNAAGEDIGYVTSGTQSPSLAKAIGMAYVRKDFAAEGSDVFVVVRDRALKAQVVKIPFLA